MLRGYGQLKGACYLALRIRAGAAARDGARTWLAEIADKVTPAAVGVADEHLNVAFTYAGLVRLGLPDHALAGFPSEFIEGVAGIPRGGSTASHRSEVLGDIGSSAPELWRWGNQAQPIHVALLLFTRDEKAIEAFAKHHAARVEECGLEIVGAFPAIELPGRKEHFGFRDGISQPALRNANPADRQPGVLGIDRPENTVEPGEFLFGYPNHYGDVASGPTVQTELDPQGILPTSTWQGLVVRDFARNGSFLVWRQLEEHVQDFWNAIRDNADDDAAARRKLAAKFFGRWPSGVPLALAPEVDPLLDPAIDPKRKEELENTNDFSYMKGDPYGYHTPFGAHIRRGNPRDWHLSPDPERSLVVASAHRIIRRGRPYGPPVDGSMDPEKILAVAKPDTGERGVHFLCFMADIERQFELIQGTWLNGRKFGGLYDEVDPMLGAPDDDAGGSFTLQGTPIRRRITGLPRFVTVRGAAYLFMPSLDAVRFLSTLQPAAGGI